MADLHIVALVHMGSGIGYRRKKTGWEHFSVPALSPACEIACASAPDDTLDLISWAPIPEPGRLIETSRHPPQVGESDWEEWRDAQSASDPDIRPLAHVAAATTPQGDLYFVAVSQNGSLWYTTKFADGSWLPTWLGDFPSPNIRPIADVACASSPNGSLVVCALTREGKLFYAIRALGGGWSDTWLADFPAPDVRPIARPRDLESWFRWSIRPIACAVAPTGQLCVCIVSEAGDLHYAVRGSGGVWQSFQRVDPGASGLAAALGSVAMAISQSGEIHVAVVTRPAGEKDDGQLWYVKNWTGFERIAPSLSHVCGVGIGFCG